jgi:hypothetical protein
VSVEMLYLLIAKSIICLAIVTYSDSLVRWEILILASLVELAREDYKRWNILARRVNILDRRYLLIITWLNDSRLTNYV